MGILCERNVKTILKVTSLSFFIVSNSSWTNQQGEMQNTP